MDITTLAAAKTYTNNKVEEIIKGGDTSVVDPTLSLSGAAADAKVTGDRLGAIEYQTVTTDMASEHKDLPDGEKTIVVYNDKMLGTTEYLNFGKDLIPRDNGFNVSFPRNGITVSKTNNGFHVSGTSGKGETIYLKDNAGNHRIPIDSDLIGKTIKVFGCSNQPLNNLGCGVFFYDEAKTLITKGTIYVSKSSTFNSKSIVVPENTAYISYGINLPLDTETVYDNDFQFYAALESDLTTLSLTEDMTDFSLDNDFQNIITFPYLTSVKIKMPITDYIKYMSDNSEAVASLTYLTPEDFGAIGDGSTDDIEAIITCLEQAKITKQTILMAKKYYVSSPINIDGSNLNIIINDIIYTGTECAVKISSAYNTVKIHSIVSSGVGLGFYANGTTNVVYNMVEVNNITSASHGIGFFATPKNLHQNTVHFSYIKAGGTDCYGIAYFVENENNYCTENNFYGGHISNCDWAVYKVGGNSKCYSFHIEGNVKGGFYIEDGNIQIFHPRTAEAQAEGEFAYYKFVGKTQFVTIYDSTGLPLTEFDLSEAKDTFENDTGDEAPLHEGRICTVNAKIGNSLQPNIYCTKVYIWGKRFIMQPYMEYRKPVATETLDTRLIGRETSASEIKELTQLPTCFVIDEANSNIYLHESYCAFGFKEFEVEQKNGFTCKIYDVNETLIFDGSTYGDGIYKLKVYKDYDNCEEHSYGMLRRDYMGHYWQVLKMGSQTQTTTGSQFVVNEDDSGNVILSMGGAN